MNLYRTGAYIVLQILNMNIYVPLYAVERHEGLDSLDLENVRVEMQDAASLFGSAIRRREKGRELYLERLSIYKADGADGVVYSGRAAQGMEFGAAAVDFSMLRTVLGFRGRASPDIRIKSIEVRIPLFVQVFLHMPIVLVAIITFYLFLSFGIEDSGLSSREIEKIPLHMYSGQEACRGCSICLEDFECDVHVRHLGCGHMFHKDCVDRWFLRNFACPVCRSRMCSKDGELYRNVHVL